MGKVGAQKGLIQPFQQALRETHHYDESSEGVEDASCPGRLLLYVETVAGPRETLI